jgi:cobalt-zinc-cadmium efflux system protein
MSSQGNRWRRRRQAAGHSDEHGHDHAHGRHDGHSHGVSADTDRRYLLIALGLLAAFMFGEVIVAVGSGSLALLSDAGHMLAVAGPRMVSQPGRGTATPQQFDLIVGLDRLAVCGSADPCVNIYQQVLAPRARS